MCQISTKNFRGRSLPNSTVAVMEEKTCWLLPEITQAFASSARFGGKDWPYFRAN